MTEAKEATKLAAIRMKKSSDLNILLANITDHLVARNIVVQGCIQREIEEKNSCRCHTYLDNIMTGKKVRISQDLGNGSVGCKLDASILSQLSTVALQELDLGPQLVIINRFGRGEAEGHGFRNVFEKAFSMDIPVLTAVKDEYIEGWREFSGELGIELNAEYDHIFEWCSDAIKVPSSINV